MKNLKILFVVTYLFLISIGASLRFINNNTPAVQLTGITIENVSKNISCSGIIEVPKYGIYSTISYDVEKLYVEVGDNVKTNDTVAVVGPTIKAKQVMAQVEDYSNKYYNNYVKTIGQVIEKIGIDTISKDVSLIKTPEYNSIVQNSKVLYSPCKGIITEINKETNGIEPLIVVSDYDNAIVNCSITEDKLKEIKIGQRVKIIGTGFKNVYYGYIFEISSQANASLIPGVESTFDVSIKINDSDKELLDGLSATCIITTNVYNDCVTVPANVIHQNNNGQEFVMLLENNRIKYKPIECFYYSSNDICVNNLTVNDKIVVSDKLLKENSIVIVSGVE